MNRVPAAAFGPAAILCASVLLFGQITTFAWGNNGHTYVNEVAAQKIPQSMPAFLRTSVAVARIAYLGPEPDRWRVTAVEWVLDHSMSCSSFRDWNRGLSLTLAKIRKEPMGQLPGGLTDGYFLRLQNAYDMLEAKRRIARKVAKIKRYKSDQAA